MHTGREEIGVSLASLGGGGGVLGYYPHPSGARGGGGGGGGGCWGGGIGILPTPFRGTGGWGEGGGIRPLPASFRGTLLKVEELTCFTSLCPLHQSVKQNPFLNWSALLPCSHFISQWNKTLSDHSLFPLHQSVKQNPFLIILYATFHPKLLWVCDGVRSEPEMWHHCRQRATTTAMKKNWRWWRWLPWSRGCSCWCPAWSLCS